MIVFTRFTLKRITRHFSMFYDKSSSPKRGDLKAVSSWFYGIYDSYVVFKKWSFQSYHCFCILYHIRYNAYIRHWFFIGCSKGLFKMQYFVVWPYCCKARTSWHVIVNCMYLNIPIKNSTPLEKKILFHSVTLCEKWEDFQSYQHIKSFIR